MPVLRDLFLALSTNRFVHDLVVKFPLSRRASRRFIAGETLAQALEAVKRLKEQGIQTTLDQLGESVTTLEQARQAQAGYVEALDALAAERVSSQVSLKLTQLGLDLDTAFCLERMREILSRARTHGILVTIDMEDSRHTQATLDLFRTLRREFDNVGIVLQAYLYRSARDLETLLPLGANVRLCKGAYKEPASVAFPKKRDVDANYIRLAQAFFDAPAGSTGAYLDLATHDEKIIAWAKEYVAARDIPRSRFEFQMLYGIRTDLQRQLAAEGYTMRAYVPYGTHWYPYFMRRLAERPANVFFFLSNLLR